MSIFAAPASSPSPAAARPAISRPNSTIQIAIIRITGHTLPVAAGLEPADSNLQVTNLPPRPETRSQRGAENFLKALTIGPAECQLGAVAQQYDIITVE